MMCTPLSQYLGFIIKSSNWQQIGRCMWAFGKRVGKLHAHRPRHAHIRRGTCAPGKRYQRQPTVKASFVASEYPISHIAKRMVTLSKTNTHYLWYVHIGWTTSLFGSDRKQQQGHVHFKQSESIREHLSWLFHNTQLICAVECFHRA